MKKLLSLLFLIIAFYSCKFERSEQTSDSGVKKAHLEKVQTDQNGNTIEQWAIKERIKRDNQPGAVKYLYIISCFSGDVLEYSTVKGKVVSSNKRITPKTVVGDASEIGSSYNSVTINGREYITDEVLDENGTYGDSGNYLYWFDTNGNQHQYYPSGGTYLHISDRPLKINKPKFSLE